jgi:hypothetical protein
VHYREELVQKNALERVNEYMNTFVGALVGDQNEIVTKEDADRAYEGTKEVLAKLESLSSLLKYGPCLGRFFTYLNDQLEGSFSQLQDVILQCDDAVAKLENARAEDEAKAIEMCGKMEEINKTFANHLGQAARCLYAVHRVFTGATKCFSPLLEEWTELSVVLDEKQAEVDSVKSEARGLQHRAGLYSAIASCEEEMIRVDKEAKLVLWELRDCPDCTSLKPERDFEVADLRIKSVDCLKIFALGL